MFSPRRLVLGLTILSALFLYATCSLPEHMRSLLVGTENGAVALQVGDKVYTRIDLERYFDSRLSDFRDPANANLVRSTLLDSFIEDKLLLCQAEHLNVQADPKMLKAMMEKIASSSVGPPKPGNAASDANLADSMVETLKTQRYMNDHLLAGISVTDDECKAYYMAHLGDYVVNDVVRVREILVDDAELARELLDSLKQSHSSNFAELARLHSKAPSAFDGGELGSFQKGDLPEEFEKVIFALGPGTFSKLVQSQYGYHIFLVEERIPAHQQKFWEVRDQISEQLQLERERAIISKELASLALRIPVEIRRDNLGFKYVGNRFSSP